MDAAWRCLARKGFQNLTVDDVCAQAQVSKGAFYGYFDSKQDMLIALLDDVDASLEAIMDELGRARLSSVERLRRFARAVFDRTENPAMVQLRADCWTELATNEAVQTRVVDSVYRRRLLLRGWIEEGVSSGELVEVPANALASILLALMDGLTLHRQVDPAGFQWPNVRAALNLLLSGLESPAPAASIAATETADEVE